jgi:hypothetical protein
MLFDAFIVHFSGKDMDCRLQTASLVIFVCSNCRHRGRLNWIKFYAWRAGDAHVAKLCAQKLDRLLKQFAPTRLRECLPAMPLLTAGVGHV